MLHYGRKQFDKLTDQVASPPARSVIGRGIQPTTFL